MTKNDDKSRKWMWWFLAAVVAAQLYFVQELLAAFALFAAGFAVIFVLVSSIYMLQKVWEVGVARMAERRSPAASMARRAAAAMEELGSRPYRRPV
jgi:predicted membrane protein